MALKQIPNHMIEYLKLGRIEFAGFLFITVITGALCIKGHSLGTMEILPLLFLAVSTNLWGFAHNDYTDIQNDTSSTDLNGRPLIKGSISKKGAVCMIIFCMAVNIIVTLLYGNTGYAVVIVIISAAFAFAYNLMSKTLPGSDVLFAVSTALLVFAGGMIISVPANFTFLFYMVILILFLENLIFNAGASLKDVKNDSENHGVTAAIYFNVSVTNNNRLIIPRSFKTLLILLKILSLLCIAISCRYSRMELSYPQIVLLAAASAGSLGMTIRAVNINRFDRQLIGKNWVLYEAATKILIPIMLYHHIGLFWTLFIIVIPFLWFLISNKIMYKKSFVLHNGF